MPDQLKCRQVRSSMPVLAGRTDAKISMSFFAPKMKGMKNVRFDDVENMMEQMMGIPIFRVSEKRQMLSTWNNSSDPNLIMDLRHKTIVEPLPGSVSQSAVLTEVTRMLMDEETQALYRKREQELLESELKKFEEGLCKSRPRFRGPYTCSKRKTLLEEDIKGYEELWKAAPRRTKIKLKEIGKSGDLQTEQCKNPAGDFIGGIKVTIKDKPTTGCKEKDDETLRRVFQIFVAHAREERRLRELKIKIQENAASRRLRKYFDIWKTRLENSRRLATRRKQEREMSDERKIELFVNAINEKQKKLAKRPVELFPQAKEPQNMKKSAQESRKSSASRTIHVVDPPAQSRLNAQRKIIAEQKMKLAEQNRIIEELRLKQIEDETRKAGRDTVNIAKEALAYCGQRTRRTLVQLMREEGCRDKTLLAPPRIPSPPRFLARMEARAEARKERVKRAEEERKRKLEEQKIKEETERREEDENRRRLQLEAQREAKRIREEQERRRARELERSKAANELADKFYRKYLLRRYVMEPFALLVELKHNRVKTATDHFDKSLLKKTLRAWQTEATTQREIKIELSISVWRRNLLWCVLQNWRQVAKAENQKGQVAADYYEMRLQVRCMKMWCKRTTEAKIRDLENQQLADFHVERRLTLICFRNWRKFVEIAEEVRESERRRDKWRELVQRVVPDFDPKQRGVLIND